MGIGYWVKAMCSAKTEDGSQVVDTLHVEQVLDILYKTGGGSQVVNPFSRPRKGIVVRRCRSLFEAWSGG